MTPAPLTSVLVRSGIAASLAWGAAGLAAQDQQPAAGAIQDGEQSSKERLLRFIDGVLPKRGTVVGEYRAEVPTSGRGRVALDAATGAWFEVTDRGGSGRSASGRTYRIDPSSREIVLMPPQSSGTPVRLVDRLPIAVLFHLRESPQAIRSATEEEGGWLVSFQHPFNPDRPAMFVRMTAEGVITESWLDSAEDRQHRAYEYAESSPPGFGLVSHREGMPEHLAHLSPRLTDVEFFPEGNTAIFEPEYVQRVVLDMHYAVQTAKNAVAAGFTRNADGTWTPPANPGATPADPGSSRWRAALIVSGTLVIGVAVFEWWRRRRVA